MGSSSQSGGADQAMKKNGHDAAVEGEESDDTTTLSLPCAPIEEEEDEEDEEEVIDYFSFNESEKRQIISNLSSLVFWSSIVEVVHLC